jgi:uncharacterized protein involved in exopolysaccharide biosynthesis
MQNGPEASLYDYLAVILKHRKILGYIVGTVFVLSVIVSLILPKMYRATARVLAPRETGGGITALLSSSDESLSNLAGNLLRTAAPAAQYVGILKSRTVADSLSLKFNLKELYGLEYSEDINKKLAKRSTIVISKKDQTIRISVEDRNPVRAAEMANAYVDLLDEINRKLSMTQGRRKRIFLEERLREVRESLEQAETNLKSFQKKYNLVAIQEQAKAAIEGAAEIKGQIIAARTELEVFKQFGTEKQIEALMLKAKIEELEKQLSAIEGGGQSDEAISGIIEKKNPSNYYIPFDKLPELSMQLVRLTREAKIEEKLFELLTDQMLHSLLRFQ